MVVVSALLMVDAVPETVTVPVPLPETVRPDVLVSVIVPPASADSVTVIVPVKLSLTEKPESVASLPEAVSEAGTVAVGA